MADPPEFVRQFRALRHYTAEDYFRNHPWDRSIVSVGSSVCQEDYWSTGRTLETLGLDGKTPEEIVRLLETGD